MQKRALATQATTPDWVKFCLVLLVGWSLLTRLYKLERPEKYVFDEVYHAVTAKLMLHNDPRAFEWWNPPPEPNTAVDWLHPPLAKYAQAASMAVFGENSYGWRFSSALTGTLLILLTYGLGRNVFGSYRIGLLAAFLASMDGLLLVQSRVAMNDIHVTAAIVAALWAFWVARQSKSPAWLLAAGILGGVSLATKWSGAYVVALMGILSLADLFSLKIAPALRRIPWLAFCFGVVPIAIYLGSYGQMYLQGKGWQHLYELHQQIWWYQTHLTATHPYQSRPEQWFLDSRPVWYSVEYPLPNWVANIYAFGNPALFWLGGIAVVTTVLCLFLMISDRLRGLKVAPVLPLKQLEPLLYVLSAYSIVWLPWVLSPRIMFFYHYTPAVPLLCLILAYWLDKIWQKVPGVAVCILSIVFLCFVVWYPHWTGMAVPVWWAEKVYFALSDWK
jgi:dolichyl-phosphate-mannose-protein mannosyltransferase